MLPQNDDDDDVDDTDDDATIPDDAVDWRKLGIKIQHCRSSPSLNLYTYLLQNATEGQLQAFKKLLSNISNTKNSVSSGYSNTENRVENTTRSQRSIFDETRGVWIADETVSFVCDQYIFSMETKAKEKTEK